jgi:ATP-dependent Clp protease adapter protein ClpS
VTAGERGKEVEQLSQQRRSFANVRPGQIRVSIHRTESFDPEFLYQLLVRVFKKSAEEAEVIIKTVELAGSADCGTYSRQVAETKVDEVRLSALRRHARIDMRLSNNDPSRKKAN